jgi:hypothetical protein
MMTAFCHSGAGANRTESFSKRTTVRFVLAQKNQLTSSAMNLICVALHSDNRFPEKSLSRFQSQVSFIHKDALFGSVKNWHFKNGIKGRYPRKTGPRKTRTAQRRMELKLTRISRHDHEGQSNMATTVLQCHVCHTAA